MSRRARAVAAAAAAVACGTAVVLAAARPVEARPHRLHLPPAPQAAAGAPASALAVDETEFALSPSRLVVAAGDVLFTAYNRGMDDHDLAVVDADGVVRSVPVPPGESRQLSVRLAPGSVKVYCSLFGGTTESHEALGMRFSLQVR